MPCVLSSPAPWSPSFSPLSSLATNSPSSRSLQVFNFWSVSFWSANLHFCLDPQTPLANMTPTTWVCCWHLSHVWPEEAWTWWSPCVAMSPATSWSPGLQSLGSSCQSSIVSQREHQVFSQTGYLTPLGHSGLPSLVCTLFFFWFSYLCSFYRLISIWAGSFQYSDPISPIDISKPGCWSQMSGTGDCIFCSRHHLQLLARCCLLHWWYSHHLWCHHSSNPELFGQIHKNDVEVDWGLWRTICLWFWKPVHKIGVKLITK